MFLAKKLLSTALVLSSFSVLGAEIDHFTTLNKYLSDSRHEINRGANYFLKEAIDMSNKFAKSKITPAEFVAYKKGCVTICWRFFW